ncbi:hypothetical protein HAX54_048983 [Datura stramonium]|uniref:RRM domain-containing protein n=1 Tax=Datura stramonium TaxID=4076 RepID=A0ABS8WMT7_DATST|nr:hypothetical protein [Datura stramonium]
MGLNVTNNYSPSDIHNSNESGPLTNLLSGFEKRPQQSCKGITPFKFANCAVKCLVMMIGWEIVPCLYVGHLSSRTRSRDLERVFSKYGRHFCLSLKVNLERVALVELMEIPGRVLGDFGDSFYNGLGGVLPGNDGLTVSGNHFRRVRDVDMKQRLCLRTGVATAEVAAIVYHDPPRQRGNKPTM